MVLRAYRKTPREVSVSVLLPHQVDILWRWRDAYRYRFILSNAI